MVNPDTTVGCASAVVAQKTRARRRVWSSTFPLARDYDVVALFWCVWIVARAEIHCVDSGLNAHTYPGLLWLEMLCPVFLVDLHEIVDIQVKPGIILSTGKSRRSCRWTCDSLNMWERSPKCVYSECSSTSYMRMYYIGNHRVNKTLGTRKTRARALSHTLTSTPSSVGRSARRCAVRWWRHLGCICDC